METVQRERSERESKQRMADIRAKKEEKVFLAGVEAGRRLDGINQKNEEKRKQEMELVEEFEKRNIDLNTGKRMHSPQINRKSQKLKRTEPIEETLLRKAAEKQARLEWAKKMEEQQIADFQNVKVGEYSRFLAELMERKTNTSSQDRLLSQHKPTNRSASLSMIQEEESQCTFKPKINEKSKTLDRSHRSQTPDAAPRAQLLIQKGAEYQDKKKQLKEQIDQQRMNDCTFSPRFSSPYRMKTQRSSSVTIAERSMEWAKKTDKRLELERQQSKQKELESVCVITLLVPVGECL